MRIQRLNIKTAMNTTVKGKQTMAKHKPKKKTNLSIKVPSIGAARCGVK